MNPTVSVIITSRSRGKRIEKGRFAGVGVADDGNNRQTGFDPLLPALIAVAGKFHKLPLKPRNPVANPPPVDLQFGLPRASPADPSHQPGHLHPLAGQTGQEIFQLGKLNLNLAVQASGPPGKDVEDQLAPVDDLQLRHCRYGPDLGRGQFLVKDQQGGSQPECPDHHLPHFPLPHQEARIELARTLNHRVEDFYSGGAGQFLQLID